MAVKVWAYHIKSELPVIAGVFSVPPGSVTQWTWPDVNTRLFKRGYRRARAVGVTGGVAAFHPFRIKPERKAELYEAGYAQHGKGAEAGLFQGVRKDALGLGDWLEYLDLSPHLHGLMFGQVQGHRGDDFLIRFLEDGPGHPKELDIKDIVAYLMYILSHVGFKNDENMKATRTFGKLHNFKPEVELDPDVYNQLCQKVAAMLDMAWNPADGLHYPSNDIEDDREWVPIYHVFTYVHCEDWMCSIDGTRATFWDRLATMLMDQGVVQMGDIEHPDSIDVVGELCPDDEDEEYNPEGFE